MGAGGEPEFMGQTPAVRLSGRQGSIGAGGVYWTETQSRMKRVHGTRRVAQITTNLKSLEQLCLYSPLSTHFFNFSVIIEKWQFIEALHIHFTHSSLQISSLQHFQKKKYKKLKMFLRLFDFH